MSSSEDAAKAERELGCALMLLFALAMLSGALGFALGAWASADRRCEATSVEGD